MVRACPICKSRKWHREPLSGLIVCSEGHVLANYRNETNEVAEVGPHQLKKRTLKRPKRDRTERSHADPAVYHGTRAKYHYMQCLQLLFRKQVAALIRLWSLPPEFETICRDTWALHLALMPDGAIPPEPHHFAHSSHPPPPAASRTRERQSSGTTAVQNSTNGPRTSLTLVDEVDSERSADSSSSEKEGEAHLPKAESTSSSDSEEHAAQSDNSELANLLSEASFSSSGDENHSPTPKQHKPRHLPSAGRKKARKTRQFASSASPRGNLAVLVCALWVLRVPAGHGELIRLVETYQLPYLAPLHHLPREMTLHLSRTTIQLLTPMFPPSSVDIHALASRLARAMHSSYGILIPEINAVPLLWRAIRALNGSPFLYTLTKRLLASLDVPLTLHPSLSLSRLSSAQPPSNPSTPSKSYDPRQHQRENIPPSLAFAAGVVLALKLVYGLDGTPRSAVSETDPLLDMPEVGAWLSTLKQAHARNKRDLYAAPSDLRVLDMTAEEMDEYLDFAQGALVDPREPPAGPDEELKEQFFPLSPPTSLWQDGAHVRDTEYPLYTDFCATPLTKDPAAVQPGNKHTIYSHLDRNGTVPEEFDLVLSVAADWARVDPEEVLTMVETWERRLEKGLKGEKRAAKRPLPVGTEGSEDELRHQRSRSALREGI